MTQSTPVLARILDTFGLGSICHIPIDCLPSLKAVLRRLEACIVVMVLFCVAALLCLCCFFHDGWMCCDDDDDDDDRAALHPLVESCLRVALVRMEFILFLRGGGE
jgi:hypothetical protein